MSQRDWFADPPEGWRVTRLKNVVADTQIGVWGDDPRGDDDDIRCVRVADFDRPRNAVGSVDTVRSVPAKDRAARVLQPGDLLLEKSGGTELNPVGFCVMFSDGYEAVSSNFISRLRLHEHECPRFWLYALAASYSTKRTERSVKRTTGIQNLDQTAFLNEEFPAPPLDEQRAIADYLDRETARIDTLLEEQQRLIELLCERRGAVIRNAVLGDTNPLNTPVENRLTAIGHHFSVTLGKMLDAGKALREGDEHLPYVRAGNIQDAGLRLDDVKMMPYSASEAAELDLRAGDLLVAEGGAVGTNVVLASDMPGWSFQKTVNRIRPTSDWVTSWLGYILRTYRDTGIIDIVCNKSTIAHLTAEKLRALRVPDTSPLEQQRIAAYLDEQTARIGTLIAETERFIELSCERRSALITAAVTGQIDVRTAA